ncbi:peptide chain release factor N(5)-glutamine methyltransferase [Mesorhizobium sp. Root157]|uniref:peptide chain release factor N(5)-glutamine methyltransferase n=1 Tax=Mesorhizobium sp. Root157 TaxID=1736477 RepID=UPI0012E3726E|nr:peptide chain release factor N(5)-glutamine methyltransferase [Mesorhizobium sp. Root157]
MPPVNVAATLAAIHRAARARLVVAGVDDPALDARLLVEHISGTGRTDAIADPSRVVEADAVAAIEAALERRAAGEPVHRILGFREFYGLHLALSSETLEPRPDTETLVDALLPIVRMVAARGGKCRILDLGTGTGAIALALLSAESRAEATGTDISEDALATAASNARSLGLSDRFTAVKSDWLAGISGRYHVIASNPPYIRSDEIGTLQKEVRAFDPLRALDGGADGLEAYRIIATQSAAHLEEGGVVAVEMGSTQRFDVIHIFEQAGFAVLHALADLAGNDRVLVFAHR